MKDTIESLLENFDPNGVGLDNGHFIGLPFKEEHAELVVLSIPWDVTVSYADGTSSGPENILQASTQLDLYDADFPNVWKKGIFMRPSPSEILDLNAQFRSKAKKHIDFLELGGKTAESEDQQNLVKEINKACKQCKDYVYEQSLSLLKKGKKVGLCGGSHATPLGFLEALSEVHDSFGILQFDAHMDLRIAYEDFQLSHASIMHNSLKINNIKQLTQVGIRDYCDQEIERAKKQADRITVFTDETMKRRVFEGEPFKNIVRDIIESLPQKVYISFDIDGLDPKLCPNTGTPVPGGLEFQEAVYIIVELKKSGREIIGFDLNEVGGTDHEWDGNVGARILYKLMLATL